jgi:hypothetical protein
MINRIIDGCILGDGSISKPRNGKARLQVGNKRKEFLKWLQEYLPDSTISYSHTSDSGNDVYQLKTMSEEQWGAERRRWYPEGEKRVPDDLAITSDTVAVWYACDGTKVEDDRYIRPAAKIYNYNLNLRKLGDKFPEQYRPSSFTEGRELRFNRERSQRLWDWIDPIPGYEYKWA